MKKSIMGFDQQFVASLSVVKTNEKGKPVIQKADYTDLAIMRWFVDFQCSGRMTSIEVNGERYFFVSYKKLLDDMPLLDMSKQALYSRLQKLVSLGLLKHHYHKEFGSQAFYCMGENYIKLIHDDTVSSEVDTVSSQLETPSQPDLRPPLKSTLDHSNIKDNNVKIDNKQIPNGISPKRLKPIIFGYDTDSKIHGITPELLSYWEQQFPAVNVDQEIRSAEAWLDSNRTRRKHDIKRFLTTWLTRTQEKASRYPVNPQQQDMNPDYMKTRATFPGDEDAGKELTNGF